MSDRDSIIISTARRDYEGEDKIIIPEDATVEETPEGYWISAWIFIDKEAG